MKRTVAKQQGALIRDRPTTDLLLGNAWLKILEVGTNIRYVLISSPATCVIVNHFSEGCTLGAPGPRMHDVLIAFAI